MDFAALIPIIIIGVVITMIRSAGQKQRQEAKRRAMAEQQKETTVPVAPPKPLEPVRPTVQVPKPSPQTARTGVPQPKPAAPAYTPHEGPPSPERKLHPEHDNCSLDARLAEYKAKKASEKAHPQHADCALRPETGHAVSSVPATEAAGTDLNFTSDNILRGVIFSEIFGKPKALR